MKHNEDQTRIEGMESGIHIASFEQLADWDGWEGYEYWSAQLEAEANLEEQAGDWMELVEACQEGRNDVLPF